MAGPSTWILGTRTSICILVQAEKVNVQLFLAISWDPTITESSLPPILLTPCVIKKLLRLWGYEARQILDMVLKSGLTPPAHLFPRPMCCGDSMYSRYHLQRHCNLSLGLLPKKLPLSLRKKRALDTWKHHHLHTRTRQAPRSHARTDPACWEQGRTWQLTTKTWWLPRTKTQRAARGHGQRQACGPCSLHPVGGSLEAPKIGELRWEPLVTMDTRSRPIGVLPPR